MKELNPPPEGTIECSISGALKTMIIKHGPIESWQDILAATTLISRQMKSWENKSKITNETTILSDDLELKAVLLDPSTQVIVAGKYLLNGRVYIYPKIYKGWG